jgi:ATP-binding cassette subfamily B multidrug efflux pump
MARSHLQKLGNYLKPHWRQAGLGVGALLLVNLLGVGIPLIIRDGIDRLRVSLSFGQISQYVGVVLLLASVMWVIRMGSRILLFGVGSPGGI